MSERALGRLREYDAGLAIVLGSGLSSIVAGDGPDAQIAYGEFGEIPAPTVEGHAGRFVLSEVAGRRVIFAQGRAHLYEGHSARAATAGIRVLAAAGMKRIILTNAAGTANPDFSPGSWMAISDHLNLTGTTPLLGAPAFVDLTEVYSSKWRGEFDAAAQSLNLTLHHGVYAGLLGPQYETPAEVRMLRLLGADAIGMSTVLEAIQARALGLELAGFSCLTNWAAGLGGANLHHADVLETGQAAADTFRKLIEGALRPND
ncbi:MAG: purine-nucleoside phosphorylase [Verrucomicrobiota bacterium]|nr:purine-nucleoside phosphorylase [Verrucomicrobiota bacterium]